MPFPILNPPPFNTWCHSPFSTHHHSTRDAIPHSLPTTIQHVMPFPILKAFWHQVTNLNTANLFPTQAARYRSTMLSAWPLSPCTSYSLAGLVIQWLTRCFTPWRPGWFYQGDGFVSIMLKIKLKQTTRQAERWGENCTHQFLRFSQKGVELLVLHQPARQFRFPCRHITKADSEVTITITLGIYKADNKVTITITLGIYTALPATQIALQPKLTKVSNTWKSYTQKKNQWHNSHKELHTKEESMT